MIRASDIAFRCPACKHLAIDFTAPETGPGERLAVVDARDAVLQPGMVLHFLCGSCGAATDYRWPG